MTVLSESMNSRSTAGLVAQPVHRRFLSDLTDERGVIPKAMLRYPELAALEEQRVRLVAALREAQGSEPVVVSDAQYVAQRAQALRDGTPLPPAPPTAADLAAGRQQRERDVQAATDALLALADDICRTVREQPSFEQEGRRHIADLRERAMEMRRQAEAAEREADAAGFLVMWLERVAHDELYVATVPDGT
jgi:hypothetical protein